MPLAALPVVYLSLECFYQFARSEVHGFFDQRAAAAAAGVEK